jgi:hypothetical protein
LAKHSPKLANPGEMAQFVDANEEFEGYQVFFDHVAVRRLDE